MASLWDTGGSVYTHTHYEEARGVWMDHEEACLWYYHAAVLGEEDGVGGLRRLEDVARRDVPRVEEDLNA